MFVDPSYLQVDPWSETPVKFFVDLVAALKVDGLTEKDIEAKPPPSAHYHRVRAVYAFYGPQLDSKTGAPLFNKAA